MLKGYNMMKENQKFEHFITSKHKLFDLHIKELLDYRDLVFLFVKRTFVSQYKQTILGPAWAIVQSLLTTLMLTIFFGNIAGLAPNGVPAFAFYLCGSVAWNYFAGCLTATSHTFTSNAAIMGKVYFPRLVMPISTVISQLISFGIQLFLFLLFCFFYWLTGTGVEPNLWVLMTPILVFHLAMLSLGVGIIISSLTTKYRDLAMLVSFGVQLWMYATPVAYDMSIIPQKWMSLYMLNPVTPIINMFRYAYLGIGSPQLPYYFRSVIFTVLVLLGGIILFSKVEKTFMDTV